MKIEDLPKTGLILVDGLCAPTFAEELATTLRRAKHPVVYLEPTSDVLPALVRSVSKWGTPTIVPLPRAWLHRDCVNLEIEAALCIHAGSNDSGIVIGEAGLPLYGEKITLSEITKAIQ